jgi:hypothetical protein
MDPACSSARCAGDVVDVGVGFDAVDGRVREEQLGQFPAGLLGRFPGPRASGRSQIPMFGQREASFGPH